MHHRNLKLLFAVCFYVPQIYFSSATSLLDEAIELFDKVDTLLEGSSADHEIAFGLLIGYESEVVMFLEFYKFTSVIYLLLYAV